MARTDAQVTRLDWDIDEGRVNASIHSGSEQCIKIGSRIGCGLMKK